MGTNQYGISSGTQSGYYMCQTVVNNGQIYSFTSTLNLSGKSSDSVTYCFYTGDLSTVYTPEEVTLAQGGNLSCINIEEYYLWLACQYATL